MENKSNNLKPWQTRLVFEIFGKEIEYQRLNTGMTDIRNKTIEVNIDLGEVTYSPMAYCRRRRLDYYDSTQTVTVNGRDIESIIIRHYTDGSHEPITSFGLNWFDSHGDD